MAGWRNNVLKILPVFFKRETN